MLTTERCRKFKPAIKLQAILNLFLSDLLQLECMVYYATYFLNLWAQNGPVIKRPPIDHLGHLACT